MNIGLLLPTRNRPDNLRRLVKSIEDTCYRWGGGPPEFPLEIIAWLDDDDTLSPPVCGELGIKTISGPRGSVKLSDMWNRCYAAASPESDIFMLAGDDMVFKTYAWDLMVEDCFKAFPDKLVLVHGDDLYFGCMLGTHCFVHRRWIETVGYFTPPYFSAEFADTWVNHVAEFIGRRIFLPFIVEHLHPEYGGKAPMDQTHKERIARREHDGVQEQYTNMAPERFTDAMKLFAAIRQASPAYAEEDQCPVTTSSSPLTAPRSLRP